MFLFYLYFEQFTLEDLILNTIINTQIYGGDVCAHPNEYIHFLLK